MPRSVTIPKTPVRRPSQDFKTLRDSGILRLEQLAGETWTDYNTHDPGITFLEAFCYVLSDLGYRLGMPDEDFFAHPSGNQALLQRQFPSARRVLPAGPFTVNDYRKLLADVPGVQNAWLFPSRRTILRVDCSESRIVPEPTPITPKHRQQAFTLRGIWDIMLEFDEALSDAEKPNVTDAVRKTYHAHRNLCEDLERVETIQQENFMVCAEIELLPQADIDKVHAQILYDIQQFLTPPLRRYTVGELLDMGHTAEEIYEGPLLRNGFILDDDLDKTALPDEEIIIRTSDLLRVIFRVPGVETIRRIHLNYFDKDKTGDEGLAWEIKLPGRTQPRVSEKSPIRFFKDLLPFRSHPDKVQAHLAKLQQSDLDIAAAKSTASDDLPYPPGVFQHPGDYTSLLNDLPRTYGVGPLGLPASASEQHRVSALQLKGFLLHFDQFLANAFATAAALPNFFDLQNDDPQGFPFQKIVDLRGMDALFAEDAETFLKDISGNNPSLHIKRRHQFLDHLLARFGENFGDYVLLLRNLLGELKADSRLLNIKTAFLRDLETLAKRRAAAYDYRNPSATLWSPPTELKDSPNVSGFEHRVARLVGIDNIHRRNLVNFDIEHVAEHDEATGTDFKFKILKPNSSKVLLSGHLSYPTQTDMLFALREIVTLATDLTNYDLKTATDGRFFFNIVDKQKKIVARRLQFFKNESGCLSAMRNLRQFLAARYSEESIFIVEHLLLRPADSEDPLLPVCTEPDCSTCENMDPYSFRMTIILPAFAPRFTNMNFRRFLEKTIRLELPAHILPRICWIDASQMAAWELVYKNWLETFRERSHKPESIPNNRLDVQELFSVLNDLHSIYPVGTLHDCEDGNDENAIVLGRTQIGEMPT
ncbi:MAG: hypothetical protein ACKVU0_13905 [Saprospiraceae bacterium]